LRLSALNRGLMEGLAEFEASLTSSGYPAWLTRDPNNMGWFRAVQRQDFALEVIEKARKNAGEVAPGTEWFIEFTGELPPNDGATEFS